MNCSTNSMTVRRSDVRTIAQIRACYSCRASPVVCSIPRLKIIKMKLQLIDLSCPRFNKFT